MHDKQKPKSRGTVLRSIILGGLVGALFAFAPVGGSAVLAGNDCESNPQCHMDMRYTPHGSLEACTTWGCDSTQYICCMDP